MKFLKLAFLSALFWMLFFIFFRTAFFLLIYNSNNTLIFSDLFNTIKYGFRLDSSVCGYSLAPSVLIMILTYVLPKHFARILFQYLNYFIITLYIVLLCANMFLYRAWGTLLNYRALSFLTDWKQILASLNNLEIIIAIAALISLSALWIIIFKKTILPYFKPEQKITGVHILSIAVIIVSMVIMIRGGWQMLPVNESAAVFSSNQTLNHLAVNPIWHLGHNLNQQKSENELTYRFYNESEAEQNLAHLFTPQSDLIKILNTPQPNIVIIMLESFTADVVTSLGGEPDVAPNLEKLIADGLLFRNIYSSGARTDQAFVAILSGFPAQPNKSVMRYPDKTAKLPSLTQELKNQGYFSSFYYGGDLTFSNLNSYLNNCGFDQTTGKQQFKPQQLSAKWGAHDEFVLTKQLQDLSTMKKPFFSVLMTLSSHEPYDVPIKTPFSDSSGTNNQFKSSAWYTDHCLGNYFTQARKEAWYKNTLFILVADHGHHLPRNRSYYSHYIRHVPMIITGGALKDIYRGKVVSSTGSHHDIAATLLHQLNLSADAFKWSNDLLNKKRKAFAYLCMDEAIGWVTDSSKFVYHLEQKRFIYNRPYYIQPDTFSAKSYLQMLYSDFLKL